MPSCLREYGQIRQLLPYTALGKWRDTQNLLYFYNVMRAMRNAMRNSWLVKAHYAEGQTQIKSKCEGNTIMLYYYDSDEYQIPRARLGTQ